MNTMNTIEVSIQSFITVKRPTGQTEEVETKFKEITPAMFRAMTVATKRAGRGECIAYRNVTRTEEMEGPSQAEIDSDEYVRETEELYRKYSYGEIG